MEHASITNSESHAKNRDKNREQRVRYWKAQGLTPEQAEREADLPTRRRRRHLYAVPNYQTDASNLPGPAAIREPANLSGPAAIREPAYVFPVREPTPEEIRTEVELQKKLGRMIEIPAAHSKTLDPILAHAHPEETAESCSSRRLRLNESEPQTDTGHDYTRIALLVIAAGCSTVLVYGLAESLGGGFWNYLIAAGFEYTPIALISAKIRDGKTREKTIWGGVLLFIASLALFIGPQITSLINEISIRQAQRTTYAIDLQKYENSQAMVERAKGGSDTKEATYKKILESEGEGSTKIIQAKREADKAFAEWKKVSKEAEEIQAPSAPAYSSEFVSAMQTIVTRIGLFMAAFLSVYVMRRMA